MAEKGKRVAQSTVRRKQARTTQDQTEGEYNISISSLGTSHRAGALDQATQLFPASHLHMARDWEVKCPLFYERVQMVGLHLLYYSKFITLDINMITALVERWSPSTNTFHLPVGEMTITLQDVQVILGVRIDGPPLTSQRLVGNGLRWATWRECCLELLGNCPNPNEALEDPDNNNNLVTFTMGATSHNSMMPLRWLRWVFYRESYADLDEQSLMCHIRAYCLYMIGCLLLPDTSGSHVPLQYLPLMEDLMSFSEISIGGAVLAHLYRELCLATNPTRVYIAGCLPLLQIWCWERIHISRPTLNLPAMELLQEVSLARRWVNETDRDLHFGNLLTYRNALDDLRHNQVVMTPYSQDLVQILNPICRASSEICTARVPLISYKRVEWHLPDRVMRQFGGVQSINIEAINRNFRRVDGRGRADVDWSQHYRDEIVVWFSRRQFITPIIPPSGNGREELTTYLTWYKSWASLYLSRPPNRSPTTTARSSTDDRYLMEYFLRSRDIAKQFCGAHGESQSSMQQGYDEIVDLASRVQESLFIDVDMSAGHRMNEEQQQHRRSTYDSSRRFSATSSHSTAHEPPRHSMYAGYSYHAMSSTFAVGQSSQHQSLFQHQTSGYGVYQPGIYMHEFETQTTPTMEIPNWMAPLGIPSIPSQQDLLFQQPEAEEDPRDNDGEQHITEEQNQDPQPNTMPEEIVEEAPTETDEQLQERHRKPPDRYTPGSEAIPQRKKTRWWHKKK